MLTVFHPLSSAWLLGLAREADRNVPLFSSSFLHVKRGALSVWT